MPRGFRFGARAGLACVFVALLAALADGLKSVVDVSEASLRQHTRGASGGLRAGTRGPLAIDMRAFVLRRAGEQLAATKEAETESEVSAKSMQASQQQLAAQMAKDAAEDDAEVDAESIPDAKDALAQTRNFAIQAYFYAQHAKATQRAFERLPQEAADAAATAIRDQLRSEAYAAAVQASASAVAEAPAKHTQKVVTSVAAAMEPYHFALLRAQRTAVEDERKARSAAKTAIQLADEATRLAKRAQELQASGLGIQATQTMVIAHTTAEQSANTRKWAEKLHAQADEVQNSLGTLQEYERQAAENAAQSVGVEVVHELPTQPPAE